MESSGQVSGKRAGRIFREWRGMDEREKKRVWSDGRARRQCGVLASRYGAGVRDLAEW
jgi:hypothetical protein